MKKDKIKVIHVLGKLQMGGAETLVMNIYRNIDRNKIQFDFIVHGDEIGDYEEEILKMGGKIYRVPKYKVYNHIQYKKAWNTFLKEHPEYKIIHSHVRSTASIILKIAKKYKLTTICHSHSTSNGTGIKSIIKKYLQKNIKKYCDYFFACSEESAKWLYGRDIVNSDKCIIINNAIDSSKYTFDQQLRDNLRKKYNIDNKIVIGQIGRLIDVKNHLFSLEIMKRLIEKDNNYILLIIGDGPDKDLINNKINEYKLKKNVMLLGNKNNVNEFMQVMDIFLMPSKYEGLPLALVEAQASSLHCIISKKITAGFLIEELIHKLPLENIDIWIDEIMKIKNTKRINRQKKIVENGFDVKENIAWLEKFYAEHS